MAIGLAATGYAAYVGLAWYRYGNATAHLSAETDALLDDFMPEYEWRSIGIPPLGNLAGLPNTCDDSLRTGRPHA